MSQAKDDLVGKIGKWLEEQGYPLEMLVARSYANQSAKVRQSDYYTDPESKRPREIDVIARWYDYYETSKELVELELLCCTQCKSQQDKPWIVFTSRSGSSHKYLFPVTSRDGRRYLTLLQGQGLIETKGLFGLRTSAGYGITQAFTSGKDIPYEAVMTALKASLERADNADSSPTIKDDILEKHCCPVIAVPVVVTDSRLFECYLGDQSKPVLQETGMAVIEWKYPVRRRGFNEPFCIYVCTWSSFEQFGQYLAEFRQILAGNLQLILQKPDQ